MVAPNRVEAQHDRASNATTFERVALFRMALDILARMLHVPAEAVGCIPTTCTGENHERCKQQGLNDTLCYLRRLSFTKVFMSHT